MPSCTHTPPSLRATSPILVDLTKLYYLTPLIDFEPVGNFLVDFTKLYYLTPLNGFTGRRYFYDFGTLRKVIFQEISPLVF